MHRRKASYRESLRQKRINNNYNKLSIKPISNEANHFSSMKTSSAMPMLAGKSVTYYHETASKDKKALWPVSQMKTVKVDKKGNLKVVMQPKGGLIVEK